MIDSHCHLADEAFASDLEDVIRRATDAGVERALVILEAGNTKEAAQARTLAAEVADKLLANPVIESYRIEVG